MSPFPFLSWNTKKLHGRRAVKIMNGTLRKKKKHAKASVQKGNLICSRFKLLE